MGDEKNLTNSIDENSDANQTPPQATKNGSITFSLPKKQLIIVGLVIVLILAIIIGMSIHERNALRNQLEELGVDTDGNDVIDVSNEVEISVSTLREVIAPAEELISYKYYYTDAGVYEKNQTFFDTGVNIPFTKNQQVYVYSGTIGVGFNIDEIDFDIDEDNLKITVDMPDLEVMYHNFDTSSFQSYDVKSSVFTKVNLSDYADFEEELKDYQEDKLANNSDFWKEAKANSEATLSGLLTVSGLVDNYVIQYNWD